MAHRADGGAVDDPVEHARALRRPSPSTASAPTFTSASSMWNCASQFVVSWRSSVTPGALRVDEEDADVARRGVRAGTSTAAARCAIGTAVFTPVEPPAARRPAVAVVAGARCRRPAR